MKPRVFVSSTFYDLKYIREDLSNFIKAHDFEPILFEDGDIGYKPGAPLDDSCYKAMETADMAVLIIGGNYGTAATGEKVQRFDEFISITRKEFRKGVERAVPFFVFIDKSVYVEYAIYDLNSKEIEEGTCAVKFKATKDINVFRFIKEISSIKDISITEFDKISVIKDFLSKQWSDMFKNYLSSIKEQKEIEQVQNSINSMNVLIEKMDKIMDVVGKEVLKDSKEEYAQILEEGEKAELKNICFLLSRLIRVNVDRNIIKRRGEQILCFIDCLNSMYLNQIKICETEDIEPKEIPVELANKVTPEFVKALEEQGMSIRKIEYEIFESIDTIYPILSDPDKSKEIYKLLCEGVYYYRIFHVMKTESAEEV